LKIIIKQRIKIKDNLYKDKKQNAIVEQFTTDFSQLTGTAMQLTHARIYIKLQYSLIETIKSTIIKHRAIKIMDYTGVLCSLKIR
jgi:hypothetical protein